MLNVFRGFLCISLIIFASPAHSDNQFIEVKPVKKLDLGKKRCQVVFSVKNTLSAPLELLQINVSIEGQRGLLFGGPLDIAPGGSGYLDTSVSGINCADIKAFQVTGIPVSKCKVESMNALECVESVKVYGGILIRF